MAGVEVDPQMKVISNVILMRDNKILLGLRSADRATFPGCWAVPGGHLEPGETAEEAALREMQEELGVSVGNLSVLEPIALEADNQSILFHMFTATQWQGGEPLIQNEEHSKIHWFSITEACVLENLALEGYRKCFSALTED